MDSLSVVRSLVDAVLAERFPEQTPLSDEEVKKLHGRSRSSVNPLLYDRGYHAYKYSPGKGDLFKRSFYHPKGHRLEVHFDGDEVVRKAKGNYGPKEALLAVS